MKVRGIGVDSSKFQNASAEDRKVAPADSSSFQNQLDSASQNNQQGVLKNLAEEIIKQGALVCKRCDIKELKKYKELISAFLKEAVSQSYKVDKQGDLSSNGRYKIHAKIKSVNEKVEALTDEILKEQSDPIEILKKIEDIKGLILDILL